MLQPLPPTLDPVAPRVWQTMVVAAEVWAGFVRWASRKRRCNQDPSGARAGKRRTGRRGREAIRRGGRLRAAGAGGSPGSRGPTAKPALPCAARQARTLSPSTSYSYGRSRLLGVGPSTSWITARSSSQPMTTIAWPLPGATETVSPSGVDQVAGTQSLKSAVILIPISRPRRGHRLVARKFRV